MAKYDLFYAAVDDIEVTTKQIVLTASGSFQPTHGTFDVPLSSGSYSEYVGCNVNLNQTGKLTILGTIVKATSTSVTIRPYETEATSREAVEQTGYNNTATITDATRSVCALDIDLTDAPEGEDYYYCIAYAMDLIGTDSSSGCVALALSRLRPGDPFSGDNGSFTKNRNLAVISFNGGLHTVNTNEKLQEAVHYNQAHITQLLPGHCYEFQIQMGATGNTESAVNGRIVAIRIDPTAYYQDDDSLTLDTATDSSGSWTNGSRVTTTGTDGPYIVMATGSVSNTTNTNPVHVRMQVGTTSYMETQITPGAANDRVPFGCAVWLDSIAGSQDIDIDVKNNSDGATVKLHYSNILAFKVPLGDPLSIVGLTGVADEQFVSSAQTGTANNRFETIHTSNAGTVDPAGTYIEFLSAETYKEGGDLEAAARPVFTTAQREHRSNRGYVCNTMRQHCMWFHVSDRYINSSATTSLQARPGVADANSVKAKNISYIRAEVQPYDKPKEHYREAIVAEIESGYLLKTWLPEGATDVFQLNLDEIVDVSRVLRNSNEMTKLTTEPTWSGAAADSFFWNTSEKIMKIKMPSGKDPGDVDQTVVVVALDYYGRSFEILYDDDGNMIVVKPLMVNIPGTTQELQVRGSGNKASSTIGELTLNTADASFDQSIGRKIYEGLRVRVRRGYPEISKLYRRFTTIFSGVMGIPKNDEKRAQIRIFDTGVTLNKALSKRTLSVYRGNVLVEDQPLPIIYGHVRRVPAYRITNNTGTSTDNYFKICGHWLESIDEVYKDTEDPDDVSSAATFYPNSGLLKIQSAGSGPPDDDPYRNDVVYCDVHGWRFKVDNNNQPSSGVVMVEWPGEMMKHVIQNYPRETSDQTGGLLSFAVPASISPSLSGNTVSSLSSSDVAQLNLGDIVKVREGANSYHAVITAKPSTTSITIAEQRFTGDNVSHTYTTSGFIDLVERGSEYPDYILDHESFWEMDHNPKCKRKILEGGKLIPPGPSSGYVFDQTSSVAEALDLICQTNFAYWYVNRAGRVAVDVPDFDANILNLSPGIELIDNSAWPFFAVNVLDQARADGTLTVSSSKKYEGLQSVKIENQFTGSSGTITNVPHTAMIHRVTLPRPGMYAVTLVVTLESGDGSGVCVGITDPGDGMLEHRSGLVEVSSQRWSRISFAFETKDYSSGSTWLKIYPSFPNLAAQLPTINSANLVNWLKADEPLDDYTLPEDGALLPTWYNKGSAGDFSQGTAANQPVWVADYVQGVPAVKFSDFIGALSSTQTLTPPYTICIVYSIRPDITGGNRGAFRGTGSGDNLVIIGPRSGDYRARVHLTGGTEIGTEGTPDNDNIIKVHTLVVSTTTSEYFINGVSQGTANFADTLTTLALGNEALNGAIFELITYDGALNSQDRSTLESYAFDKYGARSVALQVDNIEVHQIGAIVDDSNSMSMPFELRDEIYPEATAPFEVNAGNTEFASQLFISDNEAIGVSTAISEGKNAIQSSALLDLGDVMLDDAASAGGVLSHAVGYYGWMRFASMIETVRPKTDIPKLGQSIFTKGLTRLPRGNNEYPILKITKVTYDGDNAKIISLDGEGQIDPVYDRQTTQPGDIPIGAIVMTLDSGTPTDFEEVDELKGYFIEASSVGDFTERGALYHEHELDHTHILAAHTHTLRVGSVGNVSVSFFVEEGTDALGPTDIYERGSRGGGHTHSGGGSDVTSSSTSATSTESSITSLHGDNVPSHVCVRFLRRIANTGVNFDGDILVGFESDTVPLTWTRETDLDGYFVRGATGSAVFTGRSITQAFDPSESGSYLYLSVSGISRGSVLTIKNSTSEMRLIVSAVDTANARVFVYPLNCDGDVSSTSSAFVVLGTTVALGNDDVSGVGEEVGDVYNALTHDHDDNVPSHTHTASHGHTASMAFTSGPPNQTVELWDGQYPCSGSAHVHQVGSVTVPNDTTTSTSATGSSFSNETPAPDSFSMVFMFPDGTHKELPSGAIIFWLGETCPSGFSALDAANGLMIKGADASEGSSSNSGGHDHSFTASAHTVTHNHGGSFSGETLGPTAIGNTSYGKDSSGNLFAEDTYHRHFVTINNISSTAAGLTAATVQSSVASGDDIKPLHKRLKLCKRN